MDDEFDNKPLSADEKVEILNNVAAYHTLCDRVRGSSVNSLLFGGLMLGIWYFLIPVNLQLSWFGLIYVSLAALEFGTGLLNRFAPSPEGILLDGLVLLAFGVWNLVREALIWKGILPMGRPSPLFIVFGAYWTYQGLQVIRNYFLITAAFKQRPTRSEIRWFAELFKEAKYPDPKLDNTSVSFPLDPPITGKLLGDIAVFIHGGENIIVTRDQVELDLSDSSDPNRPPTGHLTIAGYSLPPFPLSQENWNNYVTWKSAK